MRRRQRITPKIAGGGSPQLVVLCFAMVGLIVSPVQSVAEEILIFADTEDLILDGAPTDVDSYSPAVAVSALDQAALVWSDTQAGVPDTLMRLLSRTLESQSDVVYVNQTFEETTNRTPRVVAGKDNAFTIVWSDNRSTENLFDVFFTRIDTKMQKLFDDTRVNKAIVNTNVETPDVASIGGGLICVCWVDDRANLRDVYARRFRENGTPIDGRDFAVNPRFPDVDATHPRVSGDAEGTAVIVWSDNRLLIPGPPQDSRSDIFARILPRSVITKEEGDWPGPEYEIQISNDDRGTDDAVDPAIAGNGHGLYVVSWRNQTSQGQDQHIYASVITSSGERLTDEFQVDLAPSPASMANPAVTFLGHDVFLITWYDEREGGLILGQMYDAATNQFVSIEFVVTELASPVSVASAASFSDRAFVTAWDHGQSGDRDVLGNVHFWDLLGDLNVDGRVSAHDVYWLAAGWQPKTKSSAAADLDANGFVDAGDIRILHQELRTNLADRQPLTFSVTSLAKSIVSRGASAMNARPVRSSSERPERGDRTKPRREPVMLTPTVPEGQTLLVNQEDFRLEKPVQVRSPWPSLNQAMNSEASETVQNDEREQRNQTPQKGMLFFGGKWR